MKSSRPLFVPVLLLAACAGASRAPEAPVEPAAPEVSRDELISFNKARWQAPAPHSVVRRSDLRVGSPMTAAELPVAVERESMPSVRLQLRNTRVPSFSLQDEDSLRDAVKVLANITGLPLVVTPLAEDAATDAGAIFDLDLKNPMLAEDVLKLLVRQAGDDVRWTVKHEAILVTTKAKAQGELLVKLHDVNTLTFGRTDFIAPRIDRLRLLDDIEDDDGGGLFGGVGETVVGIDEEELATLVQENIAVGTWEDDGVSIEPQNGFLFIVQTADVQRQIARFLAQLGN